MCLTNKQLEKRYCLESFLPRNSARNSRTKMFRILQLQPCCFFPIVTSILFTLSHLTIYLKVLTKSNFHLTAKYFQPPGPSHTGPAPTPGFSANLENMAVFLSQSVDRFLESSFCICIYQIYWFSV
jgi:hypothetical protein